MESAQAAQSAAVSQAQQSAVSKLQTATADHQAKIDQQVAANTTAEQAAQQAVSVVMLTLVSELIIGLLFYGN